MLSYLSECGNIFIGIRNLTYWNMLYLWEYVITFIGIWHHIYCNMLSYLLEYVILLIGI